MGAVFVLRARKLRSPYRTFGYPITPIAFIALSTWIAYAQVRQNPKESALVAAVLALVAAIYWGTIGRLPGGPTSALPTATEDERGAD